jgi:hypothetical protein
MTPQTILSYYPTYAVLDEVRSLGNYSELNIFVDLKNALQSLYMKHAIDNIVELSKKSNTIDSSIVSSVLSFLSFHKLYSLKRENLKIRYYLFFESGRSYYHQNLSKKYKISRKIDDLYGLDKDSRDLFFSVVQNNLMMIEKLGNRIPDTKVYRLLNLEADFVPYYLIRNKLVPSGDGIGNIIYSNDHDEYQCVNENTSVYVRLGFMKRLVKKGEVMKTYLKTDTTLPDSNLPLAMSVIGCSGDDVDGIQNIGSKRYLDIAQDLLKLVGGIDLLYENVVKGNPIFDFGSIQNMNKYLEKVVQEELQKKTVSMNLKLTSFEVLSRILDDPSDTEMIKRRKYLEEISGNSNIVPLDSLKKALEMNKVFLEENTLDLIYYKKSQE